MAVQAEQAHQIGSVDLIPVISDPNGKGLLRTKIYKFLDIPERMKANHEFLHKTSPRYYTKDKKSCIIGRNPELT